MGLLPMCAGLGSPSWNSRNRAPGRSPARGALRGARESRIQLTDGLIRTKETPTSPPAPSYAIIPARSFHPLRVGDAADRLLRSAAAFQAQELGLIVAALFADRRPGALHQNGLQPGGALAQAGGFALAGAFVLAGAPPRP